jgi:hypothetical protein
MFVYASLLVFLIELLIEGGNVSLCLTLPITKSNCHLYLYYLFRILVIYPQVMTNELRFPSLVIMHDFRI